MPTEIVFDRSPRHYEGSIQCRTKDLLYAHTQNDTTDVIIDVAYTDGVVLIEAFKIDGGKPVTIIVNGEEL